MDLPVYRSLRTATLVTISNVRFSGSTVIFLVLKDEHIEDNESRLRLDILNYFIKKEYYSI